MKLILLSIAIGVVVGVFGGVLLFRSPADDPSLSVSSPSVPPVAPVDQEAKRGESAVRLEPTMDIDAYYQTIIDNNIFRPLNWKPPQRVSRYTLLGTTISTDGSSAEAYIQERESHQFYTVSVGQQVGNMTVRTIAPKRVTLAGSGEFLTFTLGRVRFLNPRPSRVSPMRENLPPPVAKKKETPLTVTAKDPLDPAREWRNALEERVANIRAERKRMQDLLQAYEKR